MVRKRSGQNMVIVRMNLIKPKPILPASVTPIIPAPVRPGAPLKIGAPLRVGAPPAATPTTVLISTPTPQLQPQQLQMQPQDVQKLQLMIGQQQQKIEELQLALNASQEKLMQKQSLVTEQPQVRQYSEKITEFYYHNVEI